MPRARAGEHGRNRYNGGYDVPFWTTPCLAHAAHPSLAVKRCPHCGAKQKDKAEVCKKCGKSLTSAVTEETVHLFDVLVESLESESAREQFAKTLISLKRAPSLEGALEQTEQLPYVLFSHLSDEEAKKYERLLHVSGVPAKVRTSVLVCPYCNFSAQLEGKAAEHRDGVFYACYSCGRRFFLSFRDHCSHMLLECTVCGVLLRLPIQPRIGRYKCVCGTMIDYLGGGKVAPPPRAARPGRATVQAARKAATAEPQFIAKGAGEEVRPRPWGLYAAVALSVIAVFLLGLSLGSIRSLVRGRASETDTRMIQFDVRIRSFTADTSYEEIVNRLGPPRRITLATNGVDKNLVYSDHGYYIVVSPSASGREVYRGTYRLSDDGLLHSPGPPSGP